jgi:hypothetical protein
MNDYECKVTARVDKDLYDSVQNHFHHGQQTKLFRQIFLSLKSLIASNNFNQVLDYMYKGKPLTLPGIEE